MCFYMCFCGMCPNWLIWFIITLYHYDDWLRLSFTSVFFHFEKFHSKVSMIPDDFCVEWRNQKMKGKKIGHDSMESEAYWFCVFFYVCIFDFCSNTISNETIWWIREIFGKNTIYYICTEMKWRKSQPSAASNSMFDILTFPRYIHQQHRTLFGFSFSFISFSSLNDPFLPQKNNRTNTHKTHFIQNHIVVVRQTMKWNKN